MLLTTTMVEKTMKKGDLCKVVKKLTHQPCQYGNMVVLMSAISSWENYWVTINLTTGNKHHHVEGDLEVICEGR